ncbi:uncharacterized protein LOC112504703 [Cynara cardunculus var. scolymus]|uniref:uncharacterized protein LOC112504703 n=1 Tax=Cynara cardunculus var. scolymus TaxID=59895 RepID=UPI000D62D1C7|nr:uncharacterized protein LOC112504703 [Cynara cardunculus var. scolymus]
MTMKLKLKLLELKSASRAEAEVEVVNEILTSCEAPATEDVDAVRVDAEARDDYLPINYTTDASDVEEYDEEDDKEDGVSPDLPDFGSDLDDDDNEDDDEDDFTIQYQRPAGATKCHPQGFHVPGRAKGK